MESKARGSQSAFPQARMIEAVAYREDAEFGLTVREIFAAFSLCGIRASNEPVEAVFAAKAAVADADALIAELEKAVQL